MKYAIACLALISAQALAAPNKSPAPAFDPVPAFQELVATASAKKEWSIVFQDARTKQWGRRLIRAGEPAFDVKKTDSLVHPIVGIVKLSVDVTQSAMRDTEEQAAKETIPDNKPDFTYKVTGTYHAVANEWKLHQFLYRGVITVDPRGGVDFTMTPKELVTQKDGTIGMALIDWLR